MIEVAHLRKAFRIPESRVDSLKERVTRFSGPSYRQLTALRDLSFEIRRGEFFGIVGRNGSGKSTLLKILASIYRADAGRVRMAGRLAPFIELGVGFNPELTARENVELNGVMMGLSRREARRRLSAVLDFAELEEFVDLKLKNYSSGMLVRLAFSVMIQSDAEILLIDEVLAVGDAAFQQKCADVFHAIRESERTVVFVTHDMPAVEHYCHRALLLHDGVIAEQGDPGEVARAYLRLNFADEEEPQPAAEPPSPPADEAAEPVDEADARVVDVWLEKADGTRTTNVETGTEMIFCASLEGRRRIEGPTVAFTIHNADQVEVTGFGLELPHGDPDVLERGQRLQVRGSVENRLVPGRYTVRCWMHRSHRNADIVLHDPHVLDFVVFGQEATGVVHLDNDVRLSVER